MKKLILILFITVFGIFATNTFGQTTHHADEREHNQKRRVKRGVKSGEITKKEGKSIKHSEKDVLSYEKKAKSDGTVTKKEKARLQHKQNKASRKIFRTKHNGRDRN